MAQITPALAYDEAKRQITTAVESSISTLRVPPYTVGLLLQTILFDVNALAQQTYQQELQAYQQELVKEEEAAKANEEKEKSEE